MKRVFTIAIAVSAAAPIASCEPDTPLTAPGPQESPPPRTEMKRFVKSILHRVKIIEHGSHSELSTTQALRQWKGRTADGTVLEPPLYESMIQPSN